MVPMGRHLFALASSLPLVLFAIAIVLWARSYGGTPVTPSTARMKASLARRLPGVSFDGVGLFDVIDHAWGLRSRGARPGLAIATRPVWPSVGLKRVGAPDASMYGTFIHNTSPALPAHSSVDPDYVPGDPIHRSFRTPPSHVLLRINHYLTKSKEEWLERIGRGRVDVAGCRYPEEFDLYQSQEVRDTTIWRYSPRCGGDLPIPPRRQGIDKCTMRARRKRP